MVKVRRVVKVRSVVRREGGEGVGVKGGGVERVIGCICYEWYCEGVCVWGGIMRGCLCVGGGIARVFVCGGGYYERVFVCGGGYYERVFVWGGGYYERGGHHLSHGKVGGNWSRNGGDGHLAVDWVYEVAGGCCCWLGG